MKKKTLTRLKETSEKLSQEVTFETFFAKCVNDGKLQFWQHDEIAIFFKENRLRQKEDFQVYEDTLKRY